MNHIIMESYYNGNFHLKDDLNNIVYTTMKNNYCLNNNGNNDEDNLAQQLLYEGDSNTSTVSDLFLFIQNITALKNCNITILSHLSYY